MTHNMSNSIGCNKNTPAGSFSEWLQHFIRVQRAGEVMDVPCGTCTLCCTSSYFIHIRPDEQETLARIPKALLFPAPGLPKGHRLMGYNEHGHCPMFIENRCLIYEYRPQTCRSYDCRIFPATGLSPEKERPCLTHHAERWKFDFNSEEDHRRFAAVRAAARFIHEHEDVFPAGFIPGNLPRKAVLAIKVHEVFLDTDRNPPYEDNRIIHEIAGDIEAVLKKADK